ncbi:hypothetical protein GF314_13660 [bacterium]|nr:hypothetical protein [bacterium]
MSRMLLGLLLGLVAVPVAGLASGSITMVELGPRIHARLASDGSVSIIRVAANDTLELLEASWPLVTSGRHATDVTTFTATAREGDRRGRRGFAGGADDDGDGRRDEDRLDGRDNDGDGAIDEDFAAISHEMAVWHGNFGQTTRHLELYHWTYPTVAGLVALEYDQDGVAEPIRLTVAPGAVWRPADELVPGLVDEATGPAFLAMVEPAGLDRPVWLGAVVLDDRPRREASERLRAAGSELGVLPLDGRQTVVLAAGQTRLQVSHDLLAAGRLRDGMVDPMSGQRVGWLPDLPTPRPEVIGTVEAVALDSGRYHLRVPVGEAADAHVDPDRIRPADRTRPLTVTRLRWEPVDGRARDLAWTASERVPMPARPHEEMGVAGVGVLVLETAGGSLAGETSLLIGRLDGRDDRYDLVVTAPPPDRTVLLDDGDRDRPLRLSPRLLNNYPNPFRDRTRISYEVPATVGEAFDLDDPDAPALDGARAMPYASDPPRVTVTIFTLEGHVVAELQAGRQGVGVYEVSWDGRDPTGRTLPSGAYFCKLQIEKWDVTRRLIFVR